MQELATGAEFVQNQRGEISIALSDPAFVQSDSIVIDRDALTVFAVFHEAAHFIGMIPEGMVAALTGREHVLLSSLRGDGTVFELKAPVSLH